jgi:uncharacterized protein YhbP (UPF0306 family)
MAITRAELLAFLRSHSLAVQASMMPSWPCFPQAAVVGIAVSERFEIVFDTLESTRKVRNLRTSGRIAFVIGGLTEGDERTVQYEGFVEEPRGEALERAQRLYFQRFPEGRERQHSPGIVYFLTRPAWVRYSNCQCDPAEITEFSAEQLRERP